MTDDEKHKRTRQRVEIGNRVLRPITPSLLGVLSDFGVTLAANTEIRVWDSTAETRFIVLPQRPAGTDGWNEERLATLVTRDCMIGMGFARAPDKAPA